MKQLFISVFLALIILLQGCATTNQFKKEEPVKLILENGDKIKCYVTHIGRGQIFFKALSNQMAYRYGDMISTGQVKYVLLSNDSQLSVNEYKEYRKNLKKARLEEAQLASKGQFFDAQYEKLKKKDIGKMSDKEFRYFMLMKERENMLRLRTMDEEREARRREELSLLQQKINELEESKQMPAPPPVVQVIEKPAPSHQVQNPGNPIPLASTNTLPSADKSEISQLILEAGLAGALLSEGTERRQKGLHLTPNQEQLLADLEQSPQWQNYEEKLKLWSHRAEKALERCFLENPDDLKNKLELAFDANEPMNFHALMHQLHTKTEYGSEANDYRNLIDVVGETGAKAIINILSNFNDWRYVFESQKSFSK